MNEYAKTKLHITLSPMKITLIILLSILLCLVGYGMYTIGNEQKEEHEIVGTITKIEYIKRITDLYHSEAVYVTFNGTTLFELWFSRSELESLEIGATYRITYQTNRIVLRIEKIDGVN